MLKMKSRWRRRNWHIQTSPKTSAWLRIPYRKNCWLSKKLVSTPGRLRKVVKNTLFSNSFCLTAQAKKAIPSSWHPSKRCAGRAMWQWAGEAWLERVVLKADKSQKKKEGPEEDIEALKQTASERSLSEAEKQVVENIKWTVRKTRGSRRVPYFQFTCKAPWGPKAKLNQSSYYTSQEQSAKSQGHFCLGEGGLAPAGCHQTKFHPPAWIWGGNWGRRNYNKGDTAEACVDALAGEAPSCRYPSTNQGGWSKANGLPTHRGWPNGGHPRLWNLLIIGCNVEGNSGVSQVTG